MRWLLIHGKYEQVERQLQRICWINGTKLPDGFDCRDIEAIGHEESGVKTKPVLALFVSPVLRLRTIIICFIWVTCSLIYYALSWNTGALHGNIYVNTFISGAVEIPAYVVSILLMDWPLLGRRWTGLLSLVGAGLASFICIPMLILHYTTAATVFSLFGKALITVAYGVVYVIASELFPTEVRSVGMGTANMFSRIGSMSASFVGGPLMTVWKPLPSMVFGVCATLSGLSYALLPETLGRPLADTVEEAERRFYRKSSPDGCSERCSSVFESENVTKGSHVNDAITQDGLDVFTIQPPVTATPAAAAETECMHTHL